MQHRRELPVPDGDRSPFGDLARIVEDGDEPMRREFRRRAGHGAVQDADLDRLGEHAAQGDRLVEGGDEKPPAACFGERGRDRQRAQAIGIGFDDRGAARRRDPLRQRAPIRRHTREIDLEDGGRAVGRIAGHRSA